MKQLIIFLTTIVIFSIAAISQTNHTIRNGGYRSLDEFKANTPYIMAEFTVKKRKKGDIFMIGGNDYSIGIAEYMEDALWGVYQDGILYLNCKPLTQVFGYAKVEIFGHYCFLRIAFPFKKEILQELATDNPAQETVAIGSLLGGGIGAAIAGGVPAQERIGLVYELKTGKKWLLKYENMLSLLEDYETIKADYLLEAYPQIPSIMRKYLERINHAANDKSLWYEN
jgi:hypothetical protein